MQVDMEKPSMPTIWLDTSVIIEIAKDFSLKSRSKRVQDERYLILYNLVQQKVRQRRILCPEGDQEEEYLLGRTLIRECHDVQSFLSMGIKFKHREQIKKSQLLHVMKAYIEGRTRITIPYQDAFYNDPIQELATVKDYIITVRPSASDDEIEAMLQSRETICAKIEALRQEARAGGVTYEQQLNKEYTGEINAILSMLDQYEKRIALGEEPSIEDAMNAGFLLVMWKHYNGKPQGLQGLIDFFHSDSYRSVPYVDIRCKLWAKIVTNNAKVKTGDTMDIEQLSAVMPYCHFIVTDWRMKNLIIDLGLDTKYNTAIFSIRDIDSLQNRLGSL